MIDIDGLEELEEFIWESHEKNKICVLYFGAEWCGPCKKLKERLASDEAKEKMSNLVVGHLDVDESNNEPIAEKYKVTSLPTQIFVKLEGTHIKEVDRIIGLDWTKFLMTYESLSKTS